MATPSMARIGGAWRVEPVMLCFGESTWGMAILGGRVTARRGGAIPVAAR